MSYTENLIRQYNKDDERFKRKPSAIDDSRRFGTWSYVNAYDALYDKYSQNKNFDTRDLQEATQLGDQDNYFALLEANKDSTLSDEFYDDEYYNYDERMTELYLPFADNTKVEKYTRDVFDNVTGKWVTEDIGEMTQRQYFQYLLNESRAARKAEIQRAIEQDQKDAMGFWGQFGGDVAATFGELGEGLLTAVTSFVDVFGALGYASFKALSEWDNWADAFVEYFADVGLTQAEKKTIRAALDEYERTNTHFRDIDGNITGVGQYVCGIANSIGMMVPSILLAIPTGGTNLAFLPMATFYTSIFGMNMYENATDTTLTGGSWQKIINAGLKTAAEAVIEYALGTFLGGTIQNRLLGMNSGKIGKEFAKGFGKWSGIKYLFKSAGQEGLEEFLQDFGTSCIDAAMELCDEGYGKRGINMQALIDSFFIGALSSMFMSGGHVALGGISSAVKNAKKPGSGDLVIEIDGKIQKITGLNKLHYSQLLSEFKESAEKLAKSKFSKDKNIELAQEVYGALSVISQFYSSMSSERIKNCEKILGRVIKASESRTEIRQDKTTDRQTKKSELAVIDAAGTTLMNKLSGEIDSIFGAMTVGTQLKHITQAGHKKAAEDAKKAAKKASKKLEKGGVTKTTGASTKSDEGIQFTRNPAIEQLEQALDATQMSRLDELHKEYEHIFTTDGHVAVDEDGFLFVSEAWLENYTTSEIYEFLAQSQILDIMLEDKGLQPLVTDIEAFYKEFTKNESADRERIMLDFLFNSSVYQAFILSDGGKYIHKHKDILFNLYSYTNGFGDIWIKDNAELSEYRKGIFNKVLDAIKKTWREPTLKAILIWGIDRQLTGADAVLTDKDREFIELRKRRDRVLRDAGKTERSAYEHLIEDILEQISFNEEELALIEKYRDGTANDKERLEARILLDFADRNVGVHDYTISPEYSKYFSFTQRLREKLREITFAMMDSEFGISDDRAVEEFTYLIKDIKICVDEIYENPNLSQKLRKDIAVWYERNFDSGLIERGAGEDLMPIAIEGVNILQDYLEAVKPQSTVRTDYAITLPYQTASLLEQGDTAGAQLVTDVLNEFRKRYGISAKQMMSGDLTGMSVQQHNQLTQDMESFGIEDNPILFVQRYIEGQLGDNYIVTPTASQIRPLKRTADTTKLLEDIKTEQKEVLSLIDKIYRALYRSNKKDSNELSDWLLEFYTTAKNLLSPPSELETFLQKEDFGWIDTLAKAVTQVSSSRESLNVISKNRKAIKDFYNKMLSNIELVHNSNVMKTDVYDFRIAKKISAEKLLPKDLNKMSRDERKELFYHMTKENRDSDKVLNEEIVKVYNNIIRALEDPNRQDKDYLTWLAREFGMLVDRTYAGEQITPTSHFYVESLIKGREPMSQMILAVNGEIAEDADPLLVELFEPILRRSKLPAKIEDLIDISQFDTKTQEFIRGIKLVIEPYSYSYAGYYDMVNKKLVVCADLKNPFSTFVHEFNHLLQDAYGMPNGFDPDTAQKMTGLLTYIVNNYPVVVNYYLRKQGLDTIDGEVTEQDISLMWYTETEDALAMVAYMLVQGEVWARTYDHNGKQVHGFLQIFDSRNYYILAPDGKTKFKVPYDNSSNSKSYSQKMPEALVQSAAEMSMLNILRGRGYTTDRTDRSVLTQRDTVHSAYTGDTSSFVSQQLMDPGLGVMIRYGRHTLDDLISNPSLLRPEIREKLIDGSRGDVFYRIKEYVEEHIPGVSIDRMKNSNRTVFVSDNAFDKLLTRDMIDYGDNTDASTSALYVAYGERGEVPLSTFYKSSELRRLGLVDIPVIISSKVKSEFVKNVDGKYPDGAIMIHATENTSDAALIDALNHEFRHFLQDVSDFHGGFSAKIKVTQDMIDDLKEHLPAVFKDEGVRKFAEKAKTSSESVDAYIARHVIYYSVSGEVNAYAIEARHLAFEPAYVIRKGGTPTVVMPWHITEGKLGYKTEYTSYHAEDTNKNTGVRARLPHVERKRKYTNRTVITNENDDIVERIYEYEKKVRRFNKTKAEGTNLMYYWKKGESYRQMDPELQEFIIDTTGHESELPVEIVKAIKNAVLDKQALFEWFRTTDTMNQFTFDLIKRHFFPNTAFNSFTELSKFLTSGLSMWWAVGDVLRKDIKLEYLLKEKSVAELTAWLNLVENTKYNEKIQKRSLNYYGDVVPSEKLLNYQRLFAMQYFDGTLAGAFYVSHSFKKTLREYEAEIEGTSLDQTLRPSDTKNNKATTVGDTLSDEDAKMAGSKGQNNYGNDIRAIYQITDIKTFDEMMQELVLAYTRHEAEKAGFDTSDMSALRNNTDFLPILQATLAYYKQLQRLRETNPDAIEQMWTDLTNASLVGIDTDDQTFDTKSNTTDAKQTRKNIATRIKRKSEKILNYIREGNITFDQLPDEIQAMYTLETATTESGKKTQTYVLKPEVYSVGRGRARVSEGKSTGRFTYQETVDISKSHDIFKHDVSQILENDRKLNDTIEGIKKTLKLSPDDKAIGKNTLRQVQKTIERSRDTIVESLEKGTKKIVDAKIKEFRTKKQKYTQTDTPNIFTVSSAADMPDVLYKILNTSFDEFADTEVQFVSKDKEGNLYKKEDKKTFDGLVKHERKNWDAFYEANYTTLQTLTRNDVLEIITYFANAKVNDGPVGKFAAFEIFLLGFFVDAARHNYNNWDFSPQEIANLEKLYENRASAAGSALNAVSQMIKVIDPMKYIRDRMLDDWTAINDADKDLLFDLLDKVRAIKNPAKDTVKTKDGETVNAAEYYNERINALFAEFVERQHEHDKITAPRWSKKWWSKVWKTVKSFRYMSMLSGPPTWIRNQLSNFALTGFNKSADSISDFIFSKIGKKGYRQDQWNLKGTKVSDEAKSFIDLYIKENPVLNPVYNLSGKWDARRKKEIDGERGLFISVITKAYEREYAAKANWIVTKIIQKGISDGLFIKGATLSYFGKMLTIEVERNNIDLSQGLSGKVLNLFAEAVILSNAEYMHKRSALADMIDTVRDKHPVLYEGLMFWQPFMNSSINWFTEKFIKLTPIGLIDACVRAAKFEEQVAKLDARRKSGETVANSRAAEFLIRRDIGKGIVGTLLWGVGIILACAGMIRIDEEDDEFYLYTGDGSVKIDISELFGSSSLFVGASIAQGWLGQEDGLDAVEDVIGHLTNTLLDGFIVADILERHRWDNNIFDALITETNSLLSSFSPQIIQLIIALTNNRKIRYSSGFRGVWERFLNNWIPTQPMGNTVINVYTGETEDKYALPGATHAIKLLLGQKVYWITPSEEERMCRELEVNRGMLTGEITIDGQKKKLDRISLNEKYGELNKNSLAKIKSQKHKVEMPDGKYKTLSWDNMSDKQRASVLNRTFNTNADIAKIYVWTQEMGKKYYASDSMWQTLRQLGITTNVYKGDKGFVE